jgi:SAM-dependent methyltransferase
MAPINVSIAAEHYAARVDAVVAQRTRLRGPQPAGDLFAGLAADSPLLNVDPRRSLDPNLQILASHIEPDDVIIDVGGGAGRVSLALALRCREVINVEPSGAMRASFSASVRQAGITNARVIAGDWRTVAAPMGTVAVVNHVTYLAREIVPFIEKLEQAGQRRVLITVNSPPAPSWHRALYYLVHGEIEEIVPGHVELVNVLWELGILPDVRVLPRPVNMPFNPAPTREAAIADAMLHFPSDQWSLWPLGSDLEQRLRHILQARFDELFTESSEGLIPRWITPGREILIAWQPNSERRKFPQPTR